MINNIRKSLSSLLALFTAGLQECWAKWVGGLRDMRLTGEAGVDASSDTTGVVGVDETGNACCRTFDETVVVGVAGAGPFALGGDALIVMLGIMRFVTPCFASKIRYR
jgi:threonine dehydrogenase-like Zn-dependent dehydrogenase